MAPDAQLDGARVYDVGWTPDRSALRVGLVGAPTEFRVGVERGVACVLGPGLPEDAPVSLHRGRAALVERLRSLGPARGIHPPSFEDLLAEVPDTPRRPAELPESDPDAPLLRRDCANYAWATGTSPTFVDVGDGDPGVYFPAAADSARVGSVRPLPIGVLERRAHRDRMHALGFGLEAGAVRVVPTPATFRARLRRLGVEAPVRPVVRGIWGSREGAGWSRELLAGVFPIAIPHPVSVRLPLVRVTPSTFCHDLGFHLLPLTFVPRRSWSSLVQAAATKLGAGLASAAVAAWLGGPLTRACWDAWARAERPEEVAPLLMEGWESLLGRLGEPER